MRKRLFAIIIMLAMCIAIGATLYGCDNSNSEPDYDWIYPAPDKPDSEPEPEPEPEPSTAYDLLEEKEKNVFHMMVDFSYYMKNPSSARILSGVFDGDYSDDGSFEAALCILGTNSFGATVRGYYNINGLDGEITYYYDMKDPIFSDMPGLNILDAMETDDFEYAAVNDALEEYWEDFM